MIVDATGQIVGRLSTYVAKKALMGEVIYVVNAEKALFSGQPDAIIAEKRGKLDLRNKGNFRMGPFHQKRPDKFVRKTIRGMLPWKRERGREAYSRIMVYIGVPETELAKQGVDVGKEEMIHVEKVRDPANYTSVEQVCKSIGGKW